MQIPKQNTVAHFTGTGCYSLSGMVAAIPDYVTSCLRKRLVKEQATICIDSQLAVAALGVRGTKSLLVVDCMKKLTALLEVNQVTIIWIPGNSGIL